MRSQVAIEYVILVSVFLVFLTPVWIYAYRYTSSLKQQIAIDYAQELVNTIGDLSDFVYSQGKPAAMTFEGAVPDHVSTANINGSLIIMTLNISAGITDIFKVCNSNVTGTIPTERGNYVFLIKAERGYVNVSVQ